MYTELLRSSDVFHEQPELVDSVMSPLYPEIAQASEFAEMELLPSFPESRPSSRRGIEGPADYDERTMSLSDLRNVPPLLDGRAPSLRGIGDQMDPEKPTTNSLESKDLPLLTGGKPVTLLDLKNLTDHNEFAGTEDLRSLPPLPESRPSSPLTVGAPTFEPTEFGSQGERSPATNQPLSLSVTGGV